MANCQRTSISLGPKEYVAYMDNPNHGLIKKVTLNDMIYEFHCKTPQYLAIKQNVIDGDSKGIESRIKQLKSTLWFYVYIKSKSESVNPLKDKVSGLDEYNTRLAYFLDQAKNSFSLSSEGKRMKQIAYHFENNYGLTPYDTAILGFEVDGYDKDYLLEYEDKLFGAGRMKITIEKQDLIELPTLKL